MSKFKVGDKVKGTKQANGIYTITNEDMSLGEITQIYEFKRGNGIYIKILKHKDKEYEGKEFPCLHFNDSYFELVQPKQFTKDDLKERYIVVTRNGNEYVVMNKVRAIGILNGEFNCKYIDFKNYNNDLTDKNKRVWDIVQILKPHYDKVWERTEELPKEVTMKEVCEKFGYEVKIIK